jgi:hypothetical protein
VDQFGISANAVLLGGGVLLALLVDVAVMQPSMLIDAFNPVTLNVAGMALYPIEWITRPNEVMILSPGKCNSSMSTSI